MLSRLLKTHSLPVALMAATGLFATVSVATGCSSGHADRPELDQIQTGATLAGPREGVFLRAAFDDDPSMYLGRFIAEGVEGDAIDENRAVRTSCSQHISYREVRAQGNFDEYYNSSTSVQASMGVDAAAGPGGQANLDHQRGTEIRVNYELNRRLIAEIEDYDAFTDCCESTVGGCSGYYIGEFWGGTGTVYQVAGRSTDLSGGGSGGNAAVQAGGDLDVADGWAWRRAMTFDDVYFAFRIMDVGIGGCSWVDTPPRSDEGYYFVGISPPAATQDMARTFAMRNARTQVVQYLGEAIVAESVSVGTLQGYLEDETVVATAAEGIAARVSAERYCPPERLETPEGLMYISRVLAFIPNEQIDGASRDMVRAVRDETGDDSIDVE